MQPAIQNGLFALLLVSGCAQANARVERKPTPVRVQTLQRVEDTQLARYAGSLEPVLRVDMAFRVGGYVEALGELGQRPLDRGDRVRKGALLARLRPHDYAQKAASARAVVSEARSQLRLAEAELERARKLLDSLSITRAEYDSKLARAESAQANLEASQASLAQAQLAVEDTVLRAPADGVVFARQIEHGSLVAPNQLAFTIADTSALKVVFGVPQQLVEKLQLGSELQVLLDDRPQRRIPCAVTRIAPAADSLGRVFTVEALIPNPDGALRAGSVVSVHVPSLATGEQPLLVPLAAIQRSSHDARGFSVFVLDGQHERARAASREVSLGNVLGNQVSVLAGLEPGARVVTVGASLLRDGSDAVVIR